MVMVKIMMWLEEYLSGVVFLMSRGDMSDENKSLVDIQANKRLRRSHWPPAGMVLLVMECVKKGAP